MELYAFIAAYFLVAVKAVASNVREAIRDFTDTLQLPAGVKNTMMAELRNGEVYLRHLSFFFLLNDEEKDMAQELIERVFFKYTKSNGSGVLLKNVHSNCSEHVWAWLYGFKILKVEGLDPKSAKITLGEFWWDQFGPTFGTEICRRTFTQKLLPNTKVAEPTPLLMKHGDGVLRETTLKREGFEMVQGVHFTLDTVYWSTITPFYLKNVKEWKESSTDVFSDIDTVDIAEAALLFGKTSRVYALGKGYLDQRGRVYWQDGRHLMSVLGNVWLRALIQCPARPLSKWGYVEVALAIATLNKRPLTEDKNLASRYAVGRDMWRKHYINPAVKGTENEIHLQRIYAADPKHWNVAIELDATASAIQHYGVLLGSKALLEATNVVTHAGNLQDVWSFAGFGFRNNAKDVLTPWHYASSQDAFSLTKAPKSFFKKLEKACAEGGIFYESLSFKDWIKEHANPQEFVKVQIEGNSWYVCANKYLRPSMNEDGEMTGGKVVSSKTTRTPVVMGLNKNGSLKRAMLEEHEIQYAPNLKAFKRYFVSFLMHHRDSEIANAICLKVMQSSGWILPVHDAFIIHPNDGLIVRKTYRDCIKWQYEHRMELLSDYLWSIGCRDNGWKSFVHELPAGTRFGFMMLK